MKTITVQHGAKIAFVDDEDIDLVSQYKWYSNPGPVYCYSPETGKKVSMASMVMKHLDTVYDHKDRNQLNNCKDNLRPASYSNNLMNTEKRKADWKTTSKYKGVDFVVSRKKWRARIQICYRQKHIGLFETEVEAALAYNNKAIELFKEFACLNKV